MAKKHFPGTGPCLIHTTRVPKCDHFSPCDYQGVGGKIAHEPQAAHHIMPVSTIIAYQDESKYKKAVTKINAAYRDTKYCCNQDNNIIWLPKKPTYSKKRKTQAGWPDVWKLNLPCHNWDHNPRYNDEVKTKLRSDLWDNFTPQDPPVDCPEPEDVQVAFKGVEDHFRGELKLRGKRPYGGTLQAIKGGESNPPRPMWWYAFSMATNVRNEPVFSFGQDAKIPTALLRLI